MGKTRIPKFASEREEAEFWSAHDTTDYWQDAEEVPIEQLEVEPELRAQILKSAREKQLISLRLEKRQIKLAKQIARRKTIPYQALIRTWIEAGIQNELRAFAAPIKRPLYLSETGTTIKLGIGESALTNFSTRSFAQESERRLEGLTAS